jgi:predicted nucleotidyltransferase
MTNAVQNKRELIGKIVLHKQKIKSYGVMQLGVFGSFVRDEVSENSDVDFFIEFDLKYKTLKNLVGLSTFLQEVLGRKVEIVTPQSLNKYIGKYILKEVEYVSIAA